MTDYKEKLRRLKERRGEEPETLPKIAGIAKKGPDGLHIDFIKQIMKQRALRADPHDLRNHPARDRLVRDDVEIKIAAVNPLIRASGTESPSNGADVQVPLTRNPYRPVSNPDVGDPPHAQEFENGYQFAQGLGHASLNNVDPSNIQSWLARNPAWREGFAQAARSLGCNNVATQLTASPKIADYDAAQRQLARKRTIMNNASGGVRNMYEQGERHANPVSALDVTVGP
jgi:hypothetical protein